MSEEIKIPRLGTAAREFNIATSTIVEFLSKKGLTIEDSINAKLTIEMYDLLTVAYQTEKHIKEEAQRLEIASFKSATSTHSQKFVPEKEVIKEEIKPIESDNIPIEKTKPEPEPEPLPQKEEEVPVILPKEEKIIEKEEKQDEIIAEIEEKQEEIITVSTKEEEITEIEEQTQEETIAIFPEDDEEITESEEKQEGIAKPKIVGKVDLSTINSKLKPKKKTPKEKEALRIEKEKEKEEIKKAIVEKKKEERKKQQKEQEQKKKQEKREKEKEKKEKQKAAALTSSKDVKKTVEKPVKLTVEKETPPPPKKKEPEMIKTKIPDLKAPTVVGKLDLTSLNTKTKPKKKSHTQLIKEKEERLRIEKEKRNAFKEARIAKRRAEEDERRKLIEEKRKKREEFNKQEDRKKKEEKEKGKFIKTNVEQLPGTKVVDKINLSSSKKEKESAEKEERPLGEKRKRIKTFNKDKAFPPRDFENRDSYYRRGDRDRDFRKDRDKDRDKRAEITEVEVDIQIKKTMARMAPMGKTKASKHRREKRDQIHQEFEQAQERQAQEKNVLKVTEFITVNDIANMMNVPVGKIIATCMSIGLVVSINQRLDAENIVLLAEEYGYSVQFAGVEDEDEKIEEISNPEDLCPRAPIVTVMGHVDHGKTSLLDYIRKTNVIAGEAGGITQHIGAYEVELPDKRKITFLDTPGHEAFTAMRARGAKITDIVIIMIAADDAIMPQTIEAINHAQAAGVPMIFAINKIDKPGADPEKIRNALANMNLLVEEWGGKIQSQDISAKKGINVETLLEKVLIEAEMLELKANPTLLASGTVIESSLDKGRGYIAKILIQSGTLHKGDIVVAGTSYGKIKAMYNERNQLITSAGPSTPVLLLGLDSAPQAGDTFKVYTDDRDAKSVVSKRQQLIREQGLRTQKHITLTEIGRRIAIGDFKELNIIVKGDVDGSIEALSDSLLRLTTEGVEVKIIHKSVGQVTESDVLLASASNAIIIAFQVRPSGGARKLAEQEQIDIRTYSIIYDAINEIKDAIEGMKAPEMKESIVCNIEVRETFRISKVGTIAGCYVLDGKIQRNTRIRVIRDGIVIYTGKLGSLKRFKDDVKEVSAGYECGLNIESFNDIKIGDIIEGFEEVEVRK
jgi:translation initiation factor IF-2